MHAATGTIKVAIEGEQQQVRRVLCPKTNADFQKQVAKWLGEAGTGKCTVKYIDNEDDEVTMGSSEKEWEEALGVFGIMGSTPKFSVVPYEKESCNNLQHRVHMLEAEVRALKELLTSNLFDDKIPWEAIQAKVGPKHISLMKYLMQCEGPPPLNPPRPYATREQFEAFTQYFPLATLSEDLDFLVDNKLVIPGLSTELAETRLQTAPVGSFVVRPSRRMPRSMVVTIKVDTYVSHRIVHLKEFFASVASTTAHPHTMRGLAEHLLSTATLDGTNLAAIGYK
eukprot:TRINITY_DN3669_c2_g3_i1.p1 TRINITY_DN3669_c2_g3~~TRINITY_DN3669_c2_g3_i1.p1  ORF type:complete len:282 (+),score=68.76 TRINITY_DN3669_c2_g3_i1:59-904(+)